MFALCLIPIPLVFWSAIYESIELLNSSPVVAVDEKKPRYLQAFTRNNVPSIKWRPKRARDQIGPYAHLRDLLNDGDNAYGRESPALPEYTFNPNEFADVFENAKNYRFNPGN